MGYRVGVDVGGTFTDLLCVTPEGEVLLDKAPSTTEDQSVGVMNGLAQLAERVDLPLEEFCSQLEIVVHGTTVGDNTMIEMNGAETGLLVSKGHRDEIELRRGFKEEIWDPAFPAPAAIARRRARIPIPERLNYEGDVIEALDEEAVRRGVRRLEKLGVRSIAVMFLFSFVNPEHERRAAEIILEEFPDVERISLSHEVMPRGPEYERVSTTLVNAYIAPKIAKYINHLQTQLRTAGYAGQLLVMQSTGGVMPPDYVSRRAVSTLASGPTGGVMGAALAAGRAGVSDFVAMDMGGTSFDVCLVRDDRPEIKTDWIWRYRYYIGLPMVDVQSVGAGGGSIAYVDQGTLLVGPESAGSQPGPVCYGRGGTRPTVTDADVVLGYLPADGFAAGRMSLDIDGARKAIARDVGDPLGVDVIEAARGIARIVNANMANETRRILASHGADPAELSLIAYGGNGAVHAWAIAQELGIHRVLIPKGAPAFSALGVLVADYVIDQVRSYVAPLSHVNPQRLIDLRSALVGEVRREFEPAGLSDDLIDVDLYLQMCYQGQNFDMSIPLADGSGFDEDEMAELGELFHQHHEADRGFCFREQEPLVRGMRVVARGHTPKPDRFAELGTESDAESARIGTRTAYFGPEGLDVPVYDGSLLGVGAEIAGPALVQEPFTVVVLPPESTARVDADGNYVVEI